MKKIYACVALLLTASGCVSPEQAQWERDNAEITECRRLGFDPHYQAFADCRLRLRAIEAQQEQAEAMRQTANSLSYHHYHDWDDDDKHCKKTHGGNIICKGW